MLDTNELTLDQIIEELMVGFESLDPQQQMIICVVIGVIAVIALVPTFGFIIGIIKAIKTKEKRISTFFRSIFTSHAIFYLIVVVISFILNTLNQAFNLMPIIVILFIICAINLLLSNWLGKKIKEAKNGNFSYGNSLNNPNSDLLSNYQLKRQNLMLEYENKKVKASEKELEHLTTIYNKDCIILEQWFQLESLKQSHPIYRNNAPNLNVNFNNSNNFMSQEQLRLFNEQNQHFQQQQHQQIQQHHEQHMNTHHNNF